jgi:hypothetical protein
MVSDVPLTENVLRETPNFIFTYYEWLSIRGNPIIEGKGVVDADQIDLLDVPEGFVAFIHTLHQQGFVGGVAGRITTTIQNKTGGIIHELITLNAAANSSVDEDITFNPPIRIESGQKVVLRSDVNNSRATSTIFGFLVHKNDLVFR